MVVVRTGLWGRLLESPIKILEPAPYRDFPDDAVPDWRISHEAIYQASMFRAVGRYETGKLSRVLRTLGRALCVFSPSRPPGQAARTSSPRRSLNFQRPGRRLNARAFPGHWESATPQSLGLKEFSDWNARGAPPTRFTAAAPARCRGHGEPPTDSRRPPLKDMVHEAVSAMTNLLQRSHASASAGKI